MSDKWRHRGLESDEEGEEDERVRRAKQRSNSKSPVDREPHQKKHKHKHKSHKKDRKKSPNRHKKRKSKSRSPSEERVGRSRQRSINDRRSTKSRRSRSPRRERPRSRSGSSSRKRVGDALGKLNVGTKKHHSDSSSEEDVSNIIPPFSSSNVPAAAMKLKAEIEKRKQLWTKTPKPEETATSSSVWKQTAFSGDNDGKVSAKFKRLMGIKEGGNTSSGATGGEKSGRQEYFADLEKQYEVARATTHTQRGLGLGFSSRLFPR